MEFKIPRDRLLLVVITALVLFGLLTVYSASMAVGAQRGAPSYFFIRQFLYGIIGYLSMILLMLIDYHVWLKPKIVGFLIVFIVICLILVFTENPVKGSHRSLGLLPFLSFQPSELAKLILIFHISYFLHKYRGQIKNPGRPMIQCLAIVVLFVVLVVLEPDLGQALCIFSIAAVLLFIAGLDWMYIWTTVFISILALYFLVWDVAFRRIRVDSWIGALADPVHAHHQIKYATIALGSGGLLGVGFGESVMKFFFLPEAQGDFIYAIIGEELGLAGTILTGIAFLIFLYLGIRISINAPDSGGFYMGLGITLMIVMQALINISSAVAIIPTEGLTLPFISQGGSSLVVCLMASGILLNIASEKHMRIASLSSPAVNERKSDRLSGI